MTETSSHPLLSVVVPVRNEVGNVAPLVADIEKACAAVGPFEVVYVNDGSSDGTADRLAELATTRPWLRVVTHARSPARARRCAAACAMRVRPSSRRLDGDGQNDPAFLPQMVEILQKGGLHAGLVQGQRVGRKDTGFKRWRSKIANGVRGRVLKDDTRDTGCGLKCFRREAYLALPYFDALHRFMPALMAREGYKVLHADVHDRPRLTGVSNYGFFDRLWVGILDLAGVWWLIRRRKRVPRIVSETM